MGWLVRQVAWWTVVVTCSVSLAGVGWWAVEGWLDLDRRVAVGAAAALFVAVPSFLGLRKHSSDGSSARGGSRGSASVSGQGQGVRRNQGTMFGAGTVIHGDVRITKSEDHQNQSSRRVERTSFDGDPITLTVKLDDTSFFQIWDERDGMIYVPASGYTMRITVEALEDRAVILSRMRPVVLSRQPPSGTLSPLAGVLPIRRFVVFLDEDPPRLVARGRPRTDFPFKVAAHDPEVFELRVETARWDVTWVLELDWVCAGREGTTRIDLAGHPFRSMARPPSGSLDW
jgi:hypothetical protein